jgi:hypothetical protein
VNDELVTTWKDAVVVYFKVRSQHCSEETEENNDNFHSGEQASRQKIDLGTLRL